MKFLPIIIILITGLIACNNDNKNDGKENTNDNTVIATPVINYGLGKTYPHDTNAYTEGFVVHTGKLYESTGYDSHYQQTRSLFGELDTLTGIIKVKAELDKQKYFGEGIVFFKDKVYQLTYRTKTGFIYDASTFKKTGEFSYPSDEGWGITRDSNYLVMSDGTNQLTYLDPANNLKVVKKVSVTDGNGAVAQINELEYINGYIYANIYTTSTIIKIDPATGQVAGKLDLTSLVSEQRNKYPGAGEMNGIAYDADRDKIYVTGKLWMNVYEIRFGH
jgi:glutaminyl-peptide cyclotransferase